MKKIETVELSAEDIIEIVTHHLHVKFPRTPESTVWSVELRAVFQDKSKTVVTMVGTRTTSEPK